MDSPKLYVAFYRPHYGNYQHWALTIEQESSKCIIIEVVGQHPMFTRNIIEKRPEDSRRFIGKIYLGVISKRDIESIKKLAMSQPVENEIVEWDCQDYVLELLDKLEEEFILDADDEEYNEARKELQKRRGGIV
ncbi:hypothetical protein DTO169E5_1980 [Paecilomyces variotii]|nr:hypothetical protein DTO169E5_1980 [Paecilomyces variotii]